MMTAVGECRSSQCSVSIGSEPASFRSFSDLSDTENYSVHIMILSFLFPSREMCYYESATGSAGLVPISELKTVCVGVSPAWVPSHAGKCPEREWENSITSEAAAIFRKSNPRENNMKVGYRAEFVKRYLFALLRIPFLFSFGVAQRSHRQLIAAICRHFGYFTRMQGVSTIKLKDLLPDFSHGEIYEPIGTYGSPCAEEILIINELVKRAQPRMLFEFGTFTGRTTLNLAACSPDDARVFTLDLKHEDLGKTKFAMYASEELYVNKPASGTSFAASPFARKITQLYGDSAAFDFSPWRNQIDFIFIDGAHTYEYVYNDTRHALELLRDGRGTIIWHDYLMVEGLTRALNELAAQEPRLRGMRHIEGTTMTIWQSGVRD